MVLDTISDPIINRIFAFYGRATTITSRDIVGDCVAGISIDLAGTGMSPHQFAQFSGHGTKTVCQTDLQTTKIAGFCFILVFLFLMLYITFPFYT